MNWQHHFNRAGRSNSPVSVDKQQLGPIPFGFEPQGITIDGLWGVYERENGLERIRIHELPTQYRISVSNPVGKDNQLVQPAVYSSSLEQPNRATPQQTSPLSKAVMGGIGLLGAVAVAKAFSGSQETSIPDPEQAHRVFISHSWRYEDDFEEVKSLLDDAYGFEYFDHSVSSDEPLDAQLPNHLRKKFRDQIRSTSVVLALAGMYVAHSESIQDEIKIADKMGKPIIGVVPDGNDQVPNIVEDHATELVEADGNQILQAIERHTT